MPVSVSRCSNEDTDCLKTVYISYIYLVERRRRPETHHQRRVLLIVLSIPVVSTYILSSLLVRERNLYKEKCRSERAGSRSCGLLFVKYSVLKMAVQITPNLVLPQKFERLKFDQEYVVSWFIAFYLRTTNKRYM